MVKGRIFARCVCYLIPEICEICGNSDEAHTELCPRKDQSTIEQLIAERDKARSQLAALQAEAARVVGDLMICFDEPADTDSAVAMEREIRRINSARAFLASLPRPTVVAVPIEPRATPIEINEAAVKVANNVYWSVDENDDVRMRAAIVAYLEGAK